jgi:hypothetical protein
MLWVARRCGLNPRRPCQQAAGRNDLAPIPAMNARRRIAIPRICRSSLTHLIAYRGDPLFAQCPEPDVIDVVKEIQP